MNLIKKEGMKFLSILRRGFLKIFIRDYERKAMKLRRGKCKKCGGCCGDCGFLIKRGKNKICKIYKKRQGWRCYKNFPLCWFDKKAWDVEKVCRYTFQR